MNAVFFVSINLMIGIAAGIISGLGIGGGTILIPALNLFFGLQQHIAQTFNLIYFVPTAICAIAVHVKNKNVDINAFFKIVFTAIVGSIIGSSLASSFNPLLLKKIFGCFLGLVAISEISSSKSQLKSLQK